MDAEKSNRKGLDSFLLFQTCMVFNILEGCQEQTWKEFDKKLRGALQARKWDYSLKEFGYAVDSSLHTVSKLE